MTTSMPQWVKVPSVGSKERAINTERITDVAYTPAEGGTASECIIDVDGGLFDFYGVAADALWAWWREHCDAVLDTPPDEEQ